MATQLAISSCGICCNDDVLLFKNEGIFHCCEGMRNNCCNVCSTQLCISKPRPQCPFCREHLPRGVVAAIAETVAEEQPDEDSSDAAGQGGFFSGVYQGDLDDEQFPESPLSEASLVEEEEVVVEEIVYYQEHFVDPIDVRRARIPCWNHFGRNGLRIVGGCSLHGCPYAHVVRRCPYGWRCNRRESCRFRHN